MRFSFRPSRKGVSQVLGDLESEIMKEVWSCPRTSAREVWERISSRRKLAHSTVITVLDRLYKKKLLTREKQGRAFLYTSLITREAFDQSITHDVLAGLLKEDSRPTLNTFVELIAADQQLLMELEELIRRKKR